MTQDNTPSFGWLVLFVDNVPASIDFYGAALGVTVRFSPDHQYAELETGSTTLALCDRAFACGTTGLDLPASGTSRLSVTLVYSDVDAAFARAVAAGAGAVHEPMTKPWGQRTSYVTDPDGHLIEIASAISAQ